LNKHIKVTQNLIKRRLEEWNVDLDSKIYRKLPKDIYETHIVFRNVEKAIEHLTHLQHTEQGREKLIKIFDVILDLNDLHFADNYISLVYALESLMEDFPEDISEYDDKLGLEVLELISRKYGISSIDSMIKEVEGMREFPIYEQLKTLGIKPEGLYKSLGGDIVDTYEVLQKVGYSIESLVLIEPSDANKGDLGALIKLIHNELLYDYPFHFMRLTVALDDFLIFSRMS